MCKAGRKTDVKIQKAALSGLLALALLAGLSACGRKAPAPEHSPAAVLQPGHRLGEQDSPPPEETPEAAETPEAVQSPQPYTPEAQAALELLQTCMENGPQLVFAGAYLGCREGGDTRSLSAWIQDSVPALVSEMPFLLEIPESCVLGGGSGDLYCIVPRGGGSSLAINRLNWKKLGNGIQPEVGEVLYRSENAVPLLVFVNCAEAPEEPDVEIDAVCGEAALTWYPCPDPSGGGLLVPQDVDGAPLILDFSFFGDLSGLDYTDSGWTPQ